MRVDVLLQAHQEAKQVGISHLPPELQCGLEFEVLIDLHDCVSKSGEFLDDPEEVPDFLVEPKLLDVFVYPRKVAFRGVDEGSLEVTEEELVPEFVVEYFGRVSFEPLLQQLLYCSQLLTLVVVYLVCEDLVYHQLVPAEAQGFPLLFALEVLLELPLEKQEESVLGMGYPFSWGRH